MSRARWWLVGVLAVVTVSLVALDLSGVIFEDQPQASPPKPLLFPAPLTPAVALEPVAQPATSLSSDIQRSLDRAFEDSGLGDAVHAVVMGESGVNLYAQSPTAASTPASTLKLMTALAVLDSMQPNTRIETTVVHGEKPDEIVLVGGGDATLTVNQMKPGEGSPGSLQTLARQTGRELTSAGVTTVRLRFDDSLFTGPAVSAAWEPMYVTSGVIAPVTALMADQALISDDGLSRYPDPSAAAAEDFASLLKRDGVSVKGDPKRTSASPTSASPLATVQSPPVDQLVERMLRDSDNQLAEALGRLAALAEGDSGSFRGAAKVIVASAVQRQVDVHRVDIDDASGLSRDDRVTPTALAEVLQLASADELLRPILTGLPVAGFEGTLADRYLQVPQSKAAGVVRAKTGTLTGVSAEAGTSVTCSGDLVVFAFVADAVVDTVAARDALDRAAAALSTCP
ncbi:MAG TPA: D-alanyl-D-alanine carboxypeptidase/D-alanyl-D-alanine-endopeptidase [Actinomycetes bacterium]|nr:D-alanyl-D-alanine carboxypeptidase/D-alanyl-D-alanine-endopeptidase [Actinomycetes bacterium]